MRKIRGLLALGGGKISWGDLVLSDPKDGEVVVEIEAVSICHTDIGFMNGDFVDRFPTVLGHEAVGRVVEKGVNTTREIGERVGLSFAFCGKCRNCRLSRTAYCERAFEINFLKNIRDNEPVIFRPDGSPVNQFFGQSSLATASLVSEKSVFSLPESVNLRELCAIGCSIQTGAGAVMHDVIPPFVGLGMADISLGVGGCGGVGLAAIAAAKSLGVGKIVAIDPLETVHALATDMGADITVNPNTLNIERDIPAKLDYYIEASGHPDSIQLGLKLINPTKGTLLIVGAPKAGTKAAFDVVSMIPGRSIRGVAFGSGSPEFCSRLAGEMETGTYSIKPMISDFPFDELTISEFITKSHDGVVKPVFIKGD